MITPESRYQDSVKAFTTGHSYDQFGRIYLDGDDAVPNPRTNTRETLFRLSVPSAEPTSPVEYMAKDGETMTFCSWKLTGAHSNWWKMADINPHVWYPLDLKPGTLLKVPL